MAGPMSRLSKDFPQTPIAGAPPGKYGDCGNDDARMLWITKCQIAAQGIPEFPDSDRLELEYSRLTCDAWHALEESLMAENEDLRARADPKFVAALVTEKVTEQVEKFVSATVAKFTAGIVVKGILPRIADVKEQTALLPAIEKRQLELETRLRVLIALLGMDAEMSRCESMHEAEG
jgi:hypothetical protein